MRPNTEREIIVLDDQITFFRYEHALEDPASGRKERFVPCTNTPDCPVDREFNDNAYYAMYLSVIDLEGYESQTQGWVPFSRKLYVVKSGMQNKWFRLLDQNGTLRGAQVRLFREDQQKAKTGNDFELVGFVDEDELATYQREWVNREQQVQVEDCSVPYDYFALMPELSAQEIAQQLHLRHEPLPGSVEEQRQYAGDNLQRGWGQGDEPYENQAPAGRGTSRRSVTRNPAASRGGPPQSARRAQPAPQRGPARRPPTRSRGR